MKAINVPGFHFHFLDAGHRLGGHVFDLRLRRGRVAVMPIFDFGMHLLHTPLFEQADLSREDDSATRAVEKSPTSGSEAVKVPLPRR
jgi:acetolactate decarboxylase